MFCIFREFPSLTACFSLHLSVALKFFPNQQCTHPPAIETNMRYNFHKHQVQVHCFVVPISGQWDLWHYFTWVPLKIPPMSYRSLCYLLFKTAFLFSIFFQFCPQKSTPNRSMLCDHMEIDLSAGFPGQHGSLGYQATNEQMVLSFLISEKVIAVITSANKPFLSIL